MNKKVLTLCAGFLLAGSLYNSMDAVNVTTQAELEALIENQVLTLPEGDNELTFGPGTFSIPQLRYLIVNSENVTISGTPENTIVKGHFVLANEGITVKDLTIVNEPTTTEEAGAPTYADWSLYFNKTAISVLANSVTITNNKIQQNKTEESHENALANGITLYPSEATVNYNISDNEITANAASVAGDWTSTAIQLIGNASVDNIKGAIKTYTSADADIDAMTAFGDNTFNDCAVDIADYVVADADAPSSAGYGVYEAIQVTPIMENGEISKTSKTAIIDAVTNSNANSGVIIKADLETVKTILDEQDITNDVAIQFNNAVLLYGDAVNPDPTKPSVTISEDGTVIASQPDPLVYPENKLADGEEATNLLVVNNQEVKAYRADGVTTSKVSLGNYNPSNNTEEGKDRAELYQWTFEVVETQPKEYELRLKDNYGQWLTVNGKYAFVSMQASTENPDGITYDKENGYTFTLEDGTVVNEGKWPTKYVLKTTEGYVYVNSDNELDVQPLYGNEFGAGSVDVARIQAGYLLQRFGDHFTLEITYEDKDENEFDLTSIFEGELAPMKNVYYRDGKAYYDKADGWMKEFMLVNEDGEILAVNTDKEEYVAVGQNKHAYPLTTISPRQWANDQANGGDHIYATKFRFEYEPAQDALSVTEITKIEVYADGAWREIGCYYDKIDGKLTPTLVADGGVGLVEEGLSITLNPTSVVNPTAWLNQPVYYTVTVENSNKKAAHYGEILGLDENGNIAYVDPAKTDQAKPEGQFAIDHVDGKYTFTNRETGKSDSYKLYADRLYKIDATTFAYLHGNHMDTLAIEPVKDFTSEDGFVRFTADELNANTYNVAMDVINGPLYVVENHNDRHRIGLDAEEATDWRIEMSTVKVLDAAKDEVAIIPDTVTISTPIHYYNATLGEWIYTKDNTGKKKIYNDPNTELKVPTYVFLNTATSEYISGSEDKEETANDYYYCPSKTSATRFALKEVGDSTVNLVPVTTDFTTGFGFKTVKYNTWNNDIELTESQYEGKNGYAAALELSSNKVIGGTSVATGVLHDVDLYAANDNDLFVISETGAPTYKPLEQGDNIIISMLNNTDNVLYEDGEFANIDNRKIGMNPALYIDTAYVNRPGNYRYEYLLGVNILYTDTIDACNNPNHDHLRTTFSEGRYLVNMRDSMEANEDVHVNKFAYDNEPKLAFMPGYHQNDTLYLTNEAGEVISKSFLGNSAPHFAKFAFKMIDEEANEFIVEVGNEAAEQYVLNNRGDWTVIKSEPTRGYLRWHNDNLVVTNNIDNAAHFTMEETDLIATSNEEISAEEGTISVTATDGAVIIKGAAGKNVVIATILGKVVANETINSDNETIAVPAGIAVVSVDGESFKVVVK